MEWPLGTSFVLKFYDLFPFLGLHREVSPTGSDLI